MSAPSTPDRVADDFAEYAGECPLRRIKDRVEGTVVPTTALYGHRKLQRTRVCDELWRRWGFDHHVALRFDDPSGGPEVASLGLMIHRDHRRGEYGTDELSFLRGLGPSLETALRRAARLAVLEEKLANSGAPWPPHPLILPHLGRGPGRQRDRRAGGRGNRNARARCSARRGARWPAGTRSRWMRASAKAPPSRR